MIKINIQEKMKSHLVNNAIDFLKMSITELKQKPKYSVIHFHAAIELFLKARLLDEHWTLIISLKKEPDLDDFLSGKFISVTMEESFRILKKVVQCDLSERQIDTFRTIAKHRNRMIHFYHEAETKNSERNLIQAIVREQLRAWYFLHDLILNRWQTIFEKWEPQILSIDKMLRNHNDFLGVVFENLKPKIDEEKNKSILFLMCPSCGFEAERHENLNEEPYNSKCLVCGISEFCIKTSCENCEKIEESSSSVIFRGSADGYCIICKEEYFGDILLDIFIDEAESYLAAKDGGYYPFPINCGECNGFETVVAIPRGKFLCTHCFCITENFSTCGWCGDESTLLPEDTYLSGCEFCDGLFGEENS